jgi:hypothetical protein
MSKVNQRRIDLVFKTKRDDANEHSNEIEVDRTVQADHPLPFAFT